MKMELYQYDIYPKIFPVGQDVTVTLRPLGKFKAFFGEYKLSVHRMDSGAPHQGFTAWNQTNYQVTPDEDGCIRFTYNAKAEGELFVRLFQGDKRLVQLSLYALAADLAGRLPLRGDFHVHTCRSDALESPDVVCANYRKKGYDFLFITDHDLYFPSLEAIADYKDVKTGLLILPGEEVHLPDTFVHIVNAGGLWSVNGLVESGKNFTQSEGDVNARRFDESVTPPPTMSLDAFMKEIDAVEASLKTGDDPLPDDVNPRWYAVCVWAYDQIRKADGLAIFAHPYWLWNMWQIPEPFTRRMLKDRYFDAFEVLGGASYFHQNGLQTSLYYEEYKEGRIHPIVGSTDTHGSTEHNRDGDVASTIVFAETFDRAGVLNAVRNRYSVAVDTISKEYRLVGEYRLQKYAAFLMENFYPLHDRQAQMDGEMMFQYITGNATKEELETVSARAETFFEKYVRKA